MKILSYNINRSNQKIETNREELIAKCKYYKGEKVPLFEQGSSDFFFWRAERSWVNQYLKDADYFKVIQADFENNYPNTIYESISVEPSLLDCFFRFYMRENLYVKNGFVDYMKKY